MSTIQLLEEIVCSGRFCLLASLPLCKWFINTVERIFGKLDIGEFFFFFFKFVDLFKFWYKKIEQDGHLMGYCKHLERVLYSSYGKEKYFEKNILIYVQQDATLQVYLFVGRCPKTTRPTAFNLCKARGCLCSFRLLVMGGVSPETC